MAEIKPLGSEKLNGDDKLKRILELTYYNNAKNKTQSKPAELVSEAKNGGIYGIVKEKDGYYVKIGLNESSLDYIGGMFMKNKNKFSSYAEALKRLELVKGQEELQEATKYVLKQPKPQAEAPMPEEPMDSPVDEPTSDESVPPMPDDMGGEQSVEEPEMGGDETNNVDNEGKPSDYMAEVQKYAGKLGQELRDRKSRMESDDIKYVLNMIISAVDLDKLDEEDIEEIAKKFERDSEDFGDEDEMSSEEPETFEEPEEDDLSEINSIDALESFINTPIGGEEETEEIDLSKYADLGEEDDIQELDLDEIKNEINKSVGETLSKYFK
jgi:hypothetical protein